MLEYWHWKENGWSEWISLLSIKEVCSSDHGLARQGQPTARPSTNDVYFCICFIHSRGKVLEKKSAIQIILLNVSLRSQPRHCVPAGKAANTSYLYISLLQGHPLMKQSTYKGTCLFAPSSPCTEVWNKQESRRKYWATCSSVRLFTCTAQSFARSLTSLTPSLVGKRMIGCFKITWFCPIVWRCPRRWITILWQVTRGGKERRNHWSVSTRLLQRLEF